MVRRFEKSKMAESTAENLNVAGDFPILFPSVNRTDSGESGGSYELHISSQTSVNSLTQFKSTPPMEVLAGCIKSPSPPLDFDSEVSTGDSQPLTQEKVREEAELLLGVGLVDSSSAVFNEAEMPISTGFRQMAEGNVFLQNTMRFAPTVPSLGGGQARYNPSPMAVYHSRMQTSPNCPIPTFDSSIGAKPEFSGTIGFWVEVKLNKKIQSVQFCQPTNKLFVLPTDTKYGHNPCRFQFSTNFPPPDGTVIRAKLVFTGESDQTSLVERCADHFTKEMRLRNADENAARYVLRYNEAPNGRVSTFDQSSIGQRSVTIPFAGRMHTEGEYVFTCLNSCHKEKKSKERNTTLIFSLEHHGRVINNFSMEVCVCAAPTRDCQTEAAKWAQPISPDPNTSNKGVDGQEEFIFVRKTKSRLLYTLLENLANTFESEAKMEGKRSNAPHKKRPQRATQGIQAESVDEAGPSGLQQRISGGKSRKRQSTHLAKKIKREDRVSMSEAVEKEPIGEDVGADDDTF